MATDYEKITETCWDDIQPPKLLPTGSWELKVLSMKEQPSKKEGGKTQVLVAVQPIEPMSDVPEDALAELGDDWTKEVENIFMRFWFESAADKQRVRQFLTVLGVELKGLSIADSFKAAKDATFIGYINTESYTDGGGNPQVKNAVVSWSKKE